MKPTKRKNRDPLGGIEVRVDKVRKVSREGVNPLEELIKKYEIFLNVDVYSSYLVFKDFVRGKNYIPEILPPEQINHFLQMTSAFETRPNYQKNTGLFLSHLIQNSYNAGHNNFHIDLNVFPPLDLLFAYVSGTKKRRLKATIKGTAGHIVAEYCRYLDLTAENVGISFAYHAKYSRFKCKNVESDAAFSSYYCEYTIETAGNNLGIGARYTTFTIENLEGELGGAQDSIYKTRNQGTYENLRVEIIRNETIIYLRRMNNTLIYLK